jgi:hypothetical protein
MPTEMTVAGIPIKPIDCWDNRDDYYSRIRKHWGNYSLRRRMEKSPPKRHRSLFMGGSWGGMILSVSNNCVKVMKAIRPIMSAPLQHELYNIRFFEFLGVKYRVFAHESIGDKEFKDHLLKALNAGQLDEILVGISE